MFELSLSNLPLTPSFSCLKEYKFPTIARIARDHLAILATSAPSKCYFSVSANVITKERNKLSVSNTRRLMLWRARMVCRRSARSSGR